MSDYVNCESCGVEQREEDGPIVSWRGILCQSCWLQAEAEDDDKPACASGCGGYPESCMGCNLGGNR